MSKRLLDYDPVTGVSEYFVKNYGEKGFHIQTTQDVAPILKRNKQLKNDSPEHWRGDMHHVASIPLVIWQQWWRELGSDPMAKENRAWLTARLNNRDWCNLRTKEGRL